MEHRPICGCGEDMSCVKNGTPVIRYYDGEPITVVYGDTFSCPECHSRVVVNLGSPTHSGDKNFEAELSRAERNANTISVGDDLVFPK